MSMSGTQKDRAVIEAQMHLRRLGFPLGTGGPQGDGVDGQAGPATRTALRVFQRLTGLPPTGEPDGASLSALNAEAAKGTALGELVRRAAARGLAFEQVSPAAEPGEFIVTVYALALWDEARTGVPAAVTTAQAALESNYGRQVPVDLQDGRYSYNLFGIKGEGPAGSVAVWTQEEADGRMVGMVDRFRAYHDFLESIADHGAFLAGSARYAPLLGSRDPRVWAYGLQQAGYATDSRYGDKLAGIMERWALR